jgi:hypothetical protein
MAERLTDSQHYDRKVNYANRKLELADAIADHRERSELAELRTMGFPTPWAPHSAVRLRRPRAIWRRLIGG